MPVTNNPIQDYSSLSADEISTTPSPQEEVAYTADSTPAKDIHGLNEAEIADPNKILVTVSDTQAPLVILFGPPACGKTMTLVRMARFLHSKGYQVEPIRSFRPAEDKHYQKLCNDFPQMINSSDAAKSTPLISFMLVEILKGGRRLCQILEAPGEYYFNPDDPNAPFPSYVNTIIACQNRKVWTIMVEPDWKNPTDRSNYVTRITNYLKPKMSSKDHVVFVYNKIDRTKFVRSKGNVNVTEAIKNAKYAYPNIFVPFMNQNPITKWFREYNCEFVPFQTGTYPETLNGDITYQEGPEEYCIQLWKAIKQYI